GSFIYYFDVKLLIVQHGISTNELYPPLDSVAIKIMRFIILTVGKLRRIESISSPGYRTGGAAGSALIRSATWRLNKRKPVSTGSVRV
ncbi:hypothetical protein FQZ92_27765, partial [Escherichia coli]|nr:hypothetical protein [Escherichia coli]